MQALNQIRPAEGEYDCSELQRNVKSQPTESDERSYPLKGASVPAYQIDRMLKIILLGLA